MEQTVFLGSRVGQHVVQSFFNRHAVLGRGRHPDCRARIVARATFWTPVSRLDALAINCGVWHCCGASCPMRARTFDATSPITCTKLCAVTTAVVPWIQDRINLISGGAWQSVRLGGCCHACSSCRWSGDGSHTLDGPNVVPNLFVVCCAARRVAVARRLARLASFVQLDARRQHGKHAIAHFYSGLNVATEFCGIRVHPHGCLLRIVWQSHVEARRCILARSLPPPNMLIET